MIFVSFWFIAFVLVFLPLYWLAGWPGLRLLVLALGCIVFHTHFAGPAGVVPILCIALLTYLIGLTRRPCLCAVGMLVCALSLVFYKYTGFLTRQVGSLIAPTLGTALAEAGKTVQTAAPPLGISFFAFEFVHYLFDIRHGSAPLRNPLYFGIFAIFWPSLVAGPIKRYQQFIPAVMQAAMKFNAEDIAMGLPRIAVGLMKKAVADNLTLWLDHHAPLYDGLSLQWRWVFFALQATRIYFDFSGYSDIAIGYARVMGIHLPENFHWPYLSTSISEFWRRWHISLSSWIRDYVYIPIGGSHHGSARKLCNGLMAFALCGLWHGADWNFVVWGLYHGLGFAVANAYTQSRPGQALAVMLSWAPVLSWALTFLFVGCGWFLFFYPLPTALHMMRLLFWSGR